jgi:lipoic acid synthetase
MRKPDWLRKKRNISDAVLSTGARIHTRGLHTVCESARCPNLAECYGRGVATVMILGNACTRHCRFCGVDSNAMLEAPDHGEGLRIAAFARENNLSYLVMTSVTRDDLHDGGASHFVDVISQVKGQLPQLKIEVLVPDFQGCVSEIERIMKQKIDVFGHNVETVRRLYPAVRPEADYSRSLKVLSVAARIAESQSPARRVLTKSGIMVGLGETRAELRRLFRDLARQKLDILTIGQYLQPSKEHYPVMRYYGPEEFEGLRELAVGAGIKVVKAGPYIRSSYMAEESFRSTNSAEDLESSR